MAFVSYSVSVRFPGGRACSGTYKSRAEALDVAAKAYAKGKPFEAWGVTDQGKRRALRLALEPINPRE